MDDLHGYLSSHPEFLHRFQGAGKPIDEADPDLVDLFDSPEFRRILEPLLPDAAAAARNRFCVHAVRVYAWISTTCTFLENTRSQMVEKSVAYL